MKCLRSARLAVLAVIVGLGWTGCMTSLSRPVPEKSRYVLRLEPPARQVSSGPTAAVRDDVLRVERVTVTPLFERKGFVYRTPDGYESDFYNEFYASPGVLLHQALVQWLEGAQIVRKVVGGGTMLAADWLLRVDVEQLYVDARRAEAAEARLELSLALFDARKPATDPVLTSRHALGRPVVVGEAESVTAAWDSLFADALVRIESDLRSHFAREVGEPLEASENLRPRGRERP